MNIFRATCVPKGSTADSRANIADAAPEKTSIYISNNVNDWILSRRSCGIRGTETGPTMFVSMTLSDNVNSRFMYDTYQYIPRYAQYVACMVTAEYVPPKKCPMDDGVEADQSISGAVNTLPITLDVAMH